jgi:hypothetical membrane protein
VSGRGNPSFFICIASRERFTGRRYLQNPGDTITIRVNPPQTSPLTAASALCGMAAPAIFAITVFVAGYLTPGYDPVTQLMSELGVPGEPYAWLMNVVGFGLVGILLFGFSYATFRVFRPLRRVIFGSVMVAGAGLSFIAMGFYHCDQGCIAVTTAGNVHLLLGLIAIVTAMLAALTFAYVMHRERGWGGFWQYSLATAVLALVMLAVFLSFPGIAGLLQRIMVGIVFLWTEVFAIGIFLRIREIHGLSHGASHP